MTRRPRVRHLEATITPWAQFHAYVLGSIIGIRWGKISPSTGMGNPKLYDIVREYLDYAVDGVEWKKRGILDAMRYKSSSQIRDDARFAFPSLFPRNRRALNLCVPQEISNENVNFDPALIEAWKERVRVIKQEVAMTENTLEQENDETGSTSTSNNRVTVNFFIPDGVNPNDLTLDNYREITGKRYRMTKDQMERKLSREQAFAESKALAVSQLGGR